MIWNSHTLGNQCLKNIVSLLLLLLTQFKPIISQLRVRMDVSPTMPLSFSYNHRSCRNINIANHTCRRRPRICKLQKMSFQLIITQTPGVYLCQWRCTDMFHWPYKLQASRNGVGSHCPPCLHSLLQPYVHPIKTWKGPGLLFCEGFS